MDTNSINLTDLRNKLLLYKCKGFHYTLRKISKEFQVKITLIDKPSSESYCRSGHIFLGTIMDVPFERVLFHEIQHLTDFEFNNENAEYQIWSW